MSPRPSEISAPFGEAEIAAYLDRLAYHGSREVSERTLRDLQVAHLRAVPFENLDISAGRYIRLELPILFNKIVTQRRGGFCYELNGLFAAMLGGLGFEVDLLSAGVSGPTGGFGPAFDHLTLLVHLRERWLADVGFGDSYERPLLFRESEAGVKDDAGVFRIQRSGEFYELLRRTDPEWQPQYRFDLAPHALSDFVDMCHFQQTSSDSHFTHGRICSLARPGGRITLNEMKLIVTSEAGRSERALAGEEEFDSILRDSFGIVMNAAETGPDHGPSGSAGRSSRSAA